MWEWLSIVVGDGEDEGKGDSDGEGVSFGTHLFFTTGPFGRGGALRGNRGTFHVSAYSIVMITRSLSSCTGNNQAAMQACAFVSTGNHLDDCDGDSATPYDILP